MKIITNEKKIAQRKKMAGILSPIAMVLLLGGLGLNLMSLRQETVEPFYFYGTLLLLVLGFIASTISSGMVSRWVREPRADQVLTKALKGFDNKNVLLNYTTRAPHVLIGQNKVFVITTKAHGDAIQVTDGRWKRSFSVGRILRFFADEGLGNPTFEAQQNAQAVAKVVSDKLPEVETVPIEPVIVFTNPKVELTVHSSAIPVLKSKKLKSFIREQTKGAAINSEVRKQLIDILGGTVATA